MVCRKRNVYPWHATKLIRMTARCAVSWCFNSRSTRGEKLIPIHPSWILNVDEYSTLSGRSTVFHEKRCKVPANFTEHPLNPSKLNLQSPLADFVIMSCRECRTLSFPSLSKCSALNFFYLRHASGISIRLKSIKSWSGVGAQLGSH